MTDPTWESADPALRALVEAVENDSLDYYFGALALRGAARMALVRYVEGRVEKARAEGSALTAARNAEGAYDA